MWANPLPAQHTIKRLAYNCARKELRGAVVAITGYRGATHFDGTRVIVRVVREDGALGTEYLVQPGIIIDL